MASFKDAVALVAKPWCLYGRSGTARSGKMVAVLNTPVGVEQACKASQLGICDSANYNTPN